MHRKAMFESGMRFCVFCYEHEIQWLEGVFLARFVKWLS